MWSGFINVPDSSKRIHYLLVESQRDPATDPLVLWYNGGPGCSSMLGFMQEHGPFSWPDGAATWAGPNPDSWNKEANVLYIEQPAGVGYSYFANPDDIGFNFTDHNAAKDNLHAVLGWYEKFPEFKTNDLYVSGESYGGIYVPYLVYLMDTYIEANLDNPDAFLPPLKGMMVGNGVTNWTYDATPSGFELAYWNSLINQTLYDAKHENGCTLSVVDTDKSEICMRIENEFGELWSVMNVYDIYGSCYQETPTLRSAKEGDVKKPYWTA